MASAIRVRPGPQVLLANAISNLGVTEYRQRNAREALTYHTEAYRMRSLCSEGNKDLRGISSSCGNLALLAAEAGDVERAMDR